MLKEDSEIAQQEGSAEGDELTDVSHETTSHTFKQLSLLLPRPAAMSIKPLLWELQPLKQTKVVDHAYFSQEGI